MKKLISTLVLVLNYISANAQPDIQWQKTLGGSGADYAYSVQQTADGGYVVAGYTGSNDGDISINHGGAFDYWVVKLDSSGVMQWQKTLGGTGDDRAHSVQQTTDGGYVVAGQTDSNDGDVSGNHGGIFDYWVVKLDSTGTIQWQKTLGGTSDDEAYSVQQTTDGGYVVVGLTDSNDGDVSGNHGYTDYWIVKLDTAGTIQWQKTMGGTADESAYSVLQTTDGGYVVAGATSSNDGDVTGNHGGYDYWLVKLDTSGTIQWQKTQGGTNFDIPNCVQQTTDGGYVVAGETSSNDGDVSGYHGGIFDCWVVKLDATGVMQWQKTLGGTTSDYAYSVLQTVDGSYVMAGHTTSNNGDVSGNHGVYDQWLVKLASTGVLQWQKTLGGTTNDFAYSVKQTTDGGYVVAGETLSNNGDVSGNHGGYDNWVIKMQVYCFAYYTTAYDSISNNFTLTTDTATTAIAVGYHWDFGDGTTSLLPYPTHTYAVDSLYNVCMKVYTAAGDSCEYCHIIGIDTSGNVQRSGGFTLNIFNPTTVAVNDISKENTITISPNPFTSLTTITFSEDQKSTSLTVTDVLGNIVLQSTINNNQYTIDMSGYAKGVYFVRVMDASASSAQVKNVMNRKIIKN